jgi:hypothetical protein
VSRPQTAEHPNVGHVNSQARLRIAITGAFLTGYPLSVRIASYETLRHALRDALSEPGWETEEQQEQGTFQSGGGFAQALPLVIARRRDGPLLARLRGEPTGLAIQHSFDRPPGDFLRPESVVAEIYDLGIGVLTAWFELVASTELKLERLAREVKRMVWLRPGPEGRAPIAEALRATAQETAAQYGAAVRLAAPEELQASWLSRGAGGQIGPAGQAASEQGGRLLWLHPVHVVTDAERGVDGLRELVAPFSRRLAIADGVFAPRIGWSAVAVAAPEHAATPVRLTELHWAYYALYMEMDRGLLAILNQERWEHGASLKQLELDAEHVFADYLRVMEARARLDSALMALGGDELAIWQVIADVQRFEPLVEAVERKIDVLQRLAERRVAQASASRSRRATEILGSLTALTIVTVAIALISYFIGTEQDVLGHAWLRIAVVAGAFAVALSLYWLAFRERSNPEHSESALKRHQAGRASSHRSGRQ